MNQKEWMRHEIGAWRAEGLVSDALAQTLLARYPSTERRVSWGVMIAGGFGALLIGLGIIALFAANWDCFNRPERAALSIAPIAICGLVALVASLKKTSSMAFWEPLGILWCIATAAGACLVAQTYQVGGSVPSLVLFVALLTLPVVWISRSVMAMALWPIFAITWTLMRIDFEPKSWTLAMKGLAFLALSLPGYVAFLRRKPGNGALITGQLVTGLVYSLGAAIMLVSVGRVDYGWALDYGVLVFWGCSAVVALTAFVFKLPVWTLLATLVAAGASMATFHADAALYVLALVFALAVLGLGIRFLRLSYTNIGAILLLELVLAKFFASDLGFTEKGIVLILCGVAITVLNVTFVRYRKRRAA